MKRTTPPIFALLIGIDIYKLPDHDLTGCVADAEDIRAYLESLEDVHITCLYNEAATASAITDALRSLATDSHIPEGANIFIFYAGHGSIAWPPASFKEMCHGKIATLVPYDFDPGSGDSPITKNGVSSIMLNYLLEKIADGKGNNITVVFDSCYSGFGTRGATGTPRAVVLPEGTTLGADALPAYRGPMVSLQDEHKALRSHVLLAACSPIQMAQEHHGRGDFTSALTRLIRSTDVGNLTYAEAVRNVKIYDPGNQTPQCDGDYRDRIFFHTHVGNSTGSRRSCYDLKSGHGGAGYSIGAGEADEITIGSEFAVYDKKAPATELGRLVVYQVRQREALLRSATSEDFIIPDSGVHVCEIRRGTTEGDARLLFKLDSEADAEFAQMCAEIREGMCARSGFAPSFLVQAGTWREPDLVVSTEGDAVRFEITHERYIQSGVKEVRWRPSRDQETMEKFLPGVAHFFWHLRRTTTEKGYRILSVISVECYALESSGFGGGIGGMRPVGDDLCVDGVIRIGIEDEARPYGFRINNSSDVDLFVSAFHFNVYDLSIYSYLQSISTTQKGPIAMLPTNGFLTIGYGEKVAPPQTFVLDEGQNVDVGIIKLFLSTEHVDLSHIPQEYPFTGRAVGIWRPQYRLWDTVCIPIVLERQEGGCGMEGS